MEAASPAVQGEGWNDSRERQKWYKSDKVVLLWHRLLVYLSCGCGQYVAARLLLGPMTVEDCNGFWCWRALCFCDSNFAHRVLMAGTVHLQRLAKHSFKRAAALLLGTSHRDISLTTSSMQRFKMSQLLLWFFFITIVRRGVIKDVERGRASAMS